MNMMMSQSHHPRRMLPPGNSRKRKQTEADKPVPSNRLLAGYLAHEFLTKGTLFGKTINQGNQNWTEIDSDSVVSPAEQTKSQLYSTAEASDAELTRAGVKKVHESYGEVASIVKTDGTHIRGIVNPTQLSRWIYKS